MITHRPFSNNIVKSYKKRGKEEKEQAGPAGFGPNAEMTKLYMRREKKGSELATKENEKQFLTV